MSEEKEIEKESPFEICPHCGQRLSPWQQVLLSVDRAVMCKNCWYRIILSQPETGERDIKNKSRDEEK